MKTRSPLVRIGYHSRGLFLARHLDLDHDNMKHQTGKRCQKCKIYIMFQLNTIPIQKTLPLPLKQIPKQAQTPHSPPQTP